MRPLIAPSHGAASLRVPGPGCCSHRGGPPSPRRRRRRLHPPPRPSEHRGRGRGRGGGGLAGAFFVPAGGLSRGDRGRGRLAGATAHSSFALFSTRRLNHGSLSLPLTLALPKQVCPASLRAAAAAGGPRGSAEGTGVWSMPALLTVLQVRYPSPSTAPVRTLPIH